MSLIVKDGLGNTQTIDVNTNGRADAANSQPYVLSNEDFAAVGATNESAPGTDTATSGLNGRLQRIAQRLTSLIALLPTSLGQKSMANSLSVAIASDQSNVSVTVASSALPSGAATSAKQDTMITALDAISNSVSANVVVLPPSPFMDAGAPLASYQFSEVRIDVSGSGNTELVAANTGLTTKVYRMIINSSNTSTNTCIVQIRNGANALMQWSFTNNQNVILDFSEQPWFTTGANTALNLNLSANADIQGRLYYIRS